MIHSYNSPYCLLLLAFSIRIPKSAIRNPKFLHPSSFIVPFVHRSFVHRSSFVINRSLGSSFLIRNPTSEIRNLFLPCLFPAIPNPKSLFRNSKSDIRNLFPLFPFYFLLFTHPSSFFCSSFIVPTSSFIIHRLSFIVPFVHRSLSAIFSHSKFSIQNSTFLQVQHFLSFPIQNSAFKIQHFFRFNIQNLPFLFQNPQFAPEKLAFLFARIYCLVSNILHHLQKKFICRHKKPILLQNQNKGPQLKRVKRSQTFCSSVLFQ